MFVLANIEDTIRVEPRAFVKPAAVAVEDQINAKYANCVCTGSHQIIQDVGLCITLHDILEASEGRIRWGDGCMYYTGELQLT